MEPAGQADLLAAPGLGPFPEPELQAGPAGDRLGIYVHCPYCRTKCPYCDFNVAIHREDRIAPFVAGLRAELAALRGAALGRPGAGGEPVPRRRHAVPPARPRPSRPCWPTPGRARARAGRRGHARGQPRGARPGPSARVPRRRGDAAVARRPVPRRRAPPAPRAHALRGRRGGRLPGGARGGVRGRQRRPPLRVPRPGPGRPGCGRSTRRSAWAPDHLSAYALTLEPATPFGRRPPAGIPDEDLQVAQFDALVERAAAAGLARYEISNFARPGRRSRHNLGYWHRADYVGLGPGAHGAFGALRYWTQRSEPRWRAAVLAGSWGIEGWERLSARQVAWRSASSSGCAWRTACRSSGSSSTSPPAPGLGGPDVARYLSAGVMAVRDGPDRPHGPRRPPVGHDLRRAGLTGSAAPYPRVRRGEDRGGLGYACAGATASAHAVGWRAERCQAPPTCGRTSAAKRSMASIICGGVGTEKSRTKCRAPAAT